MKDNIVHYVFGAFVALAILAGGVSITIALDRDNPAEQTYASRAELCRSGHYMSVQILDDKIAQDCLMVRYNDPSFVARRDDFLRKWKALAVPYGSY